MKRRAAPRPAELGGLLLGQVGKACARPWKEMACARHNGDAAPQRKATGSLAQLSPAQSNYSARRAAARHGDGLGRCPVHSSPAQVEMDSSRPRMSWALPSVAPRPQGGMASRRLVRWPARSGAQRS
ncbi:hypothetical protein Droror1_Dr00008676, partial [Drosera rotundifolia]